MNSDLDVDVLVCQTGNCFITITWPSSQTRAEWDTAFQISPTYLYFQPCKGLCSRRPISGMVMTVISLFPNMSVSCCRAERTEGRREKTKKRKKKSYCHEFRMRLQQTRARDELLHPRGRRSHVKQTYPKTWESHEERRKYSLPPPDSLSFHICASRETIYFIQTRQLLLEMNLLKNH